MTQVFISYRHTNPDQELAAYLASYLQDRGLQIFVDSQLHVGQRWVTEIERQLRNSQFLVVLLSRESIRSDMVRQEIKLAHELGESIRILPVRVDIEVALPYDLGAYLDPIQYALWRTVDDDRKIAEQIWLAINVSTPLPYRGTTEGAEPTAEQIQGLANVTEHAGAPLPAADPRLMFDTGAVRVGSPFYIRRESDDEMEKQIQREGQTIIVKGMRQMGKSSLLARANMSAAKERKQQTFYFDFQRLEPSQLESLESLLRYIGRRLTRDMRTTLKSDDTWDESLGAKDNLTYFIEDALLANAKSPILFFFDEADQIFGYPYRDQFFSLIRAWHNDRAINEHWTRLNLIIAHSTEPHLWIQDINQSPFNVGFPIRLVDFNEAQVSELNNKHGRPLKTIDEIRVLMKLVGGQPYLVRQGLYAIVESNLSLRELEDSAADESGPFGDHLRRHLWVLEKDKDLKHALAQVLSSNRCDSEMHFQRLKAGGLIAGETRHNAHIRYELYQRYFEKH